MDKVGCVYFKKPIEEYFPIYFFFRLDLAPKSCTNTNILKTSFCFLGCLVKEVAYEERKL